MNLIYQKYQKNNPKYRAYRRVYEAKYRDENRLLWNFKSWKSARKKIGKYPSLEEQASYLLKRGNK